MATPKIESGESLLAHEGMMGINISTGKPSVTISAIAERNTAGKVYRYSTRRCYSYYIEGADGRPFCFTCDKLADCPIGNKLVKNGGRDTTKVNVCL